MRFFFTAMNNFFPTLFLTVLLAVFGCDNIEAVNPDLLYEKNIVVRAELKPYSDIQGVFISKTLPINEPFDTAKAFIKDAAAYLKINGIKIVPLHYSAEGMYKPLGTLILLPGETVELFASVENSPIYAVTKIPRIPEAVNVRYANGHLLATVKTNPGEAYGAVWTMMNPSSKNILEKGESFLSIVNAPETLSAASIDVATKDLPEKYNASYYKDYRCIKVYAFDEAYLKYFNTKNNNQPVSDAFVQGGDLIAWNVQGEHVIGLFIGVSEGALLQSQ